MIMRYLFFNSRDLLYLVQNMLRYLERFYRFSFTFHIIINLSLVLEDNVYVIYVFL